MVPEKPHWGGNNKVCMYVCIVVLLFFRNHESLWHNNFLLVRTFSLGNLAKILSSSTYEGLFKAVKLTQEKVKLGEEFELVYSK